MRMVDLIQKKRDGYAHTKEEIRFIIDGYTKDDIPDYQVSAWSMAVYFNDMNDDERAWLTEAIVNSGETIDLSAIEGVKVDKHSTGGVGDTTTLILAPLVASIGVPVAKMSGRGLGHTGGTIDKLESLKGFSVEITNDEFINLVNTNKVAVIGQTDNLTPADKKLYGLRDVTGTVNSIPLIASSIMSKKLAAGADAIVLDVKTGAGAFMKKLDQSKELAEAMVKIGNNLGRNTTAVISDMNQPLGFMIGNALEVKEAIDTLKGEGPDDLTELCYTLGSHMAVLAKKAETIEEARQMLKDAVESGAALEQFKLFIRSQGGDAEVVDHPEQLPTAKNVAEVTADQDGFVSEIIADEIGTAAMLLGAGRATKDSVIDLAVGIELHKKIGDHVQAGEVLASLHVNDAEVEPVIQKVKAAYTLTDNEVKAPQLIYDVIR
ncbi:pyrimidine-nucleoside phosphorylase [Salisediminibacterium selenitireducens]|uniref:Pyrimidine-nucleoside phosphorylase n=1 Tax=Bacillus selenitireducens (strain ATCC 700615 / DSM 15326 / MLS10) TaxID=439292 RepID=D6XVG2_BACIE|nr:pyrimidine-nucleoside phosphorylase [Salisediminibacterium selenitireducens]ADH99700.1 pyrimidine-nucleoside phosphorylase [[Bacillus] selenitireducens MLS10]